MKLDRRSLVRSATITANRIGVTPVDPRNAFRGRLLDSKGDSLTRAVDGKVVLITGASTGIGRATAVHLAAAGAVVLLVARTEELLLSLRDELRATGARADAYPCDLLDLDAVDDLVARVLADHGHVDVLVNNAGMSIRRKVVHSRERFHDFERPMQLNYFAALRLTTGLLPSMVERQTGQVVNVSSWAVQVRPPRFSGYTASKAALEAWSDCVQAEVMDDGIVFTNVRMPLVRTPMIAPTKAYRRMPALTPEQAAAVIGSALVNRSRRVSPLAGSMLSLTETVSHRAADRLRRNAV